MQLNDDLLTKNNCTPAEAALMLVLAAGWKETIAAAKKKDLIVFKDNAFSLTEKGESLLEEIMGLPSDKKVEEIKDLASKLRDIFPAGNRPGSCISYRASVQELTRRLLILTTKYKAKFSNEDALKAAKKYVSSFNGDYTYMQSLKYFIYKAETDSDGNREFKSKLLEILENKDADIQSAEDWTTTLKY